MKIPGVSQNRTPWLLLLMGVVLPAAWLALWQKDPTIYREHGPIEMFQAAVLAIGVFFWIIGWKNADSDGVKILNAGLGLLFFTILMLEFDTREMDAPLLIKWTNGKLRNIWVGLLWAGLAVWVARHWKEALEIGILWLRSRPGKFMMLSSIFWIAGWMMEKFFKFSSEGVSLMTEELMEVNGVYFMLITAALTSFYFPKNLQKHQAV